MQKMLFSNIRKKNMKEKSQHLQDVVDIAHYILILCKTSKKIFVGLFLWLYSIEEFIFGFDISRIFFFSSKEFFHLFKKNRKNHTNSQTFLSKCDYICTHRKWLRIFLFITWWYWSYIYKMKTSNCKTIDWHSHFILHK